MTVKEYTRLADDGNKNCGEHVAVPSDLDFVDLDRLHAGMTSVIESLSGLFKPGMRFTFVARHPDNERNYVVVTDDDLWALAKALATEAAKGDHERGHG